MTAIADNAVTCDKIFSKICDDTPWTWCTFLCISSCRSSLLPVISRKYREIFAPKFYILRIIKKIPDLTVDYVLNVSTESWKCFSHKPRNVGVSYKLGKMMNLYTPSARDCEFFGQILRPHSISRRVSIQNILFEFVAHGCKLLRQLGETFFLFVIRTRLLNSPIEDPKRRRSMLSTAARMIEALEDIKISAELYGRRVKGQGVLTGYFIENCKKLMSE